VIGTPFGGMTGRALTVILKLNFWKSCDHKKKLYLNEHSRILTGHALGYLKSEAKKFCEHFWWDPDYDPRSPEQCTIVNEGNNQSFSDPAISPVSDSDWSPKFGLGLGLKKSWLSYTLTQNYQSIKYLRRFNYSRYLCMWLIKGIIGF
jgi:hypothetical protein